MFTVSNGTSKWASNFFEKRLRKRCLRPAGVFIINTEPILHIVLVFPLLTLNKLMSTGWIDQ